MMAARESDTKKRQKMLNRPLMRGKPTEDCGNGSV
jgi:hypothetical protein